MQQNYSTQKRLVRMKNAINKLENSLAYWKTVYTLTYWSQGNRYTSSHKNITQIFLPDLPATSTFRISPYVLQ
jgi:hypothetical protein